MTTRPSGREPSPQPRGTPTATGEDAAKKSKQIAVLCRGHLYQVRARCRMQDLGVACTLLIILHPHSAPSPRKSQ